MITREISASEYIYGFRDVEKFERCCRECDNYGKSWLCPPFGFDIDEKLRPWSKVLLAGVCVAVEAETPVSEAMRILRPASVVLSNYLLDIERQRGGMAMGFSGRCLYCNTCSRLSGQPCRHADLARPSLESFGFDVGATAERLLGIKLKWGHNNILPDQLSLIGGVFMP